MDPFTVDGVTFTVNGLSEFFASGVLLGMTIGLLMVVATLAYGRLR